MAAKKIGEYWDRALKGGKWLAKHQATDGSWAGLEDPKVDAFYKGGWALTLTGQPIAAQRLLSYAKTRFMQWDGDFVPRGHAWHYDVHYLYANAYLTVGGMVVGRYDVGWPAADFLLTQQDPDHGGFCTRKTVRGQKNLADTISTSASGVACLAAGRLAAAQRAGDFLGHIVNLQPAPTERFYTTIEADGRLGTTPRDVDEARWRIIDARTSNQVWYCVGLPFAFLVQLSEASGDQKYLGLAKWYFDFQERCVDPWDGGSSGKAGWGCSMLYRLTGDKHYRDIALHIAEWIGQRQHADGSWLPAPSGYVEGAPLALSNGGLDVTAEYTLWLALISSNLLARDGV